MVQLVESGPEIPAFYAGRTVFITGGSGFMGKVLVERLLTTCPDISRVYLLLREKRGLSPEKRLQQIKQCQIFDVLRVKCPRQLDKVDVIGGDVTSPSLGITPAARAKLRQVSVVFHSAATVKLQGELKQSVDQNLRSVMSLMDLCDTLPNLKVFMHISTAYCNAELPHIEEKVYPPPMDLDTLLRLVETQDIGIEETRRLTASKPNTYTFTKAMAEHAVARHGCARYAVAIFRPTIVICSLAHPFPGWIENLNGPSGVIAAASSGLLRVVRSAAHAQADMLPVDIAIDTMLAAAWDTATNRSPEVRVYNCSTSANPTRWGDFLSIINRCMPQYPASNAVLYPHLHIVENSFIYKSLETVLQTIPLHLTEYIMRILCINSRRNLIKANEKMIAMNVALEYFAVREWQFDTANVTRLRQRLSEEDKRIINLDSHTINWEDLVLNFVKGTRKYVLQEPEMNITRARERMRKLNMFITLAKILGALFLLRMTTRFVSLPNLMYSAIMYMKGSSKMIL
ncbi:fatty acyl-CoA reductase 1-like [Pectinophora gossypiella]|uniref:fatty acyl-CoA reductase 1-like n=1 Tax=Pectinophora gossypiella TaxID=13191 RepID=UPI00214E4935|nr:fatty acyl-CoA reductase 1-like [Pectinophora gossypiella]